jgi:hypothetical protein
MTPAQRCGFEKRPGRTRQTEPATNGLPVLALPGGVHFMTTAGRAWLKRRPDLGLSRVAPADRAPIMRGSHEPKQHQRHHTRSQDEASLREGKKTSSHP